MLKAIQPLLQYGCESVCSKNFFSIHAVTLEDGISRIGGKLSVMNAVDDETRIFKLTMLRITMFSE